MTKRRTFNAYMAGLGAAVAFSVLPGIAMSQSASMSSDDAASSSEASQSVDDATLQLVAKAYVAVRHISDDTKQRLARTQDESEKKQISSQAESQKLNMVKQEGIQPEQYNKVLIMVQNDPGLQQKFLSYVNATGGV